VARVTIFFGMAKPVRATANRSCQATIALKVPGSWPTRPTSSRSAVDVMAREDAAA
jgi:hypothetical protein